MGFFNDLMISIFEKGRENKKKIEEYQYMYSRTRPEKLVKRLKLLTRGGMNLKPETVAIMNILSKDYGYSGEEIKEMMKEC